MKLSICVAAISIVMISAACNKQDHIDPRPNQKGCKLYEVLNPDSSVYATFYYTDWGAPSHIEQTEEGTGNWEYKFYYDSQNRLVAMNEGINREKEILTNVLWKYYYDKDLIKYDTLLNGTNIDEGSGYFAAGEYFYDSHKRVIMYVKKEFMGGRIDTTYYHYSDNKNPFTNNTSILGGNKELMFVNRDYDRVNENVLETNPQGYPTKFGPPTYYTFLSIGIKRVNYSCPVK